jgi:D-amino peptidase
MKRSLGICVLGLLVAVFLGQCQQKGLKVYISADMEGIGGVTTWDIQAGSQGREYEKFRRLMTQEVNAAINGAFDAGASEVLVSDSHGDSQNIDIELLDRRVRLVRAMPRPLGMVQGIDSTFDAAVFIGYHASEGQAPATLAHTFSGREQVKLNGNSVPEAGFNAATAGEFGVPLVFLSGDQTIVQEAKQMFGNIETVVVKEAVGFFATTTINPEQARQQIRLGVRRGIERRKEVRVYKLSHPVQLEITYKDTVKAELVSYLPSVERPQGNTIVFKGRDMIEIYRFLIAVEFLNVYHGL